VSTEFRVQSSGTGSVTELVLVGMFNVAGCQCRSSVVCFVGGAVCGAFACRRSADPKIKVKIVKQEKPRGRGETRTM